MVVAIDTETFLMLPTLRAPRMVCTSIACSLASSVQLYTHTDKALPERLRGLFEGGSDEHLTFANAPFDLAVLGRWRPDWIPAIFQALDDGRIHDVIMREKLIDLAIGKFRFEETEDGTVRQRGYSLAEIVYRWSGGEVRMEKDRWRLQYHRLYNTPALKDWPAGAVEYAKKDAELTLAVHVAQGEHFAKHLQNEVAQNQAAWALHLMHVWGFRTDSTAVRNLERKVLGEIEEIRGDLIASGLIRPTGTRDTKAATAMMLATGRWQPTDKGEEALAELGRDAFLEEVGRRGKFLRLSEDACIECGDPLLVKYGRYSKLTSLLTGTIQHLKWGTVVPVHSRFSPLMETGRTSSSGPNIQNIRTVQGIRECFVPRDGHVLIACDYKMAELHTLAQTCIDLFDFSKLGDALNAGIDVHTQLASQIVHVPYEELKARVDAKDPDAKDARQLAKAGNFGFPGGCGAVRFCALAAGYKDSQGNALELDVRDAERLRAVWMTTWSEMEHFFAYVRDCYWEEAPQPGLYWIYLPRSNRLRAGCRYTAACNTLFQGPASDGAKAALYAVTKEMLLGRLPGRVVNFVHDELICEVPEQYASEAAEEIQEIMEREFNVFVPDVPTSAEASIMRAWSKRAFPAFNDRGELIPWEDREDRDIVRAAR